MGGLNRTEKSLTKMTGTLPNSALRAPSSYEIVENDWSGLTENGFLSGKCVRLVICIIIGANLRTLSIFREGKYVHIVRKHVHHVNFCHDLV